MSEIIFRLYLTTGLVFSFIPGVVLTRPVSADWCQCVIFVLNRLGIQQIPGEYWTAASLAVPDDTGKTWMDYQGYAKRLDGELPQPGDLMVLAGGAEVITAQVWDGSEHLVPVPVDIWAGHIGIVENAQKMEKENQSYLQITLLSANWGVNAKPAGVIGSCYNVDESVFLLPVGYKKAQFFFAENPMKMRERIVNRANRWSLLGIEPNTSATLDGYPVSPAGFVSAALVEPGAHPLKPMLVKPETDFTAINFESTQSGDIVTFADKIGDRGYGIITEIDPSKTNNRQISIQATYMLTGSRAIGPETWNLFRKDEDWTRIFPDGTAVSVHFYRFKMLQGYPRFGDRGVTWVKSSPHVVNVNFILSNAGGKEIAISNIYIKVRNQNFNGEENQPAVKFPVEPKITLHAGEMFVYSHSATLPMNGEYELDIYYDWENKPVLLEKAAIIKVD